MTLKMDSRLGTATFSGGVGSLTVATFVALRSMCSLQCSPEITISRAARPPRIQPGTPGMDNHVRCLPSMIPSVFRRFVKLAGGVSPVAPGYRDSYRQCSFLDGATTMGGATLCGGAASLSVSSLAVGSHSITAVYNGDSNFNASTSTAVTQVVNRASTSTALTASPNPSNFGQTVTLRATVSAVSPGGGTPTGSVVFKDGSTTLATVSLSSGIATLSTTGLARGSHTITAAYQQSSSYAASTSTAVTQTVQ